SSGNQALLDEANNYWRSLSSGWSGSRREEWRSNTNTIFELQKCASREDSARSSRVEVSPFGAEPFGSGLSATRRHQVDELPPRRLGRNASTSPPLKRWQSASRRSNPQRPERPAPGRARFTLNR